MDGLELSTKRRKLETLEVGNNSFKNDCTISQNLNEEVCVTIANSTTNHRELSSNGVFLSRFLERLKLRTIPLISPLLERLSEAESKNILALKSIDKINKRIKDLEFHAEKRIKTSDTSSIATGADITDPNSEDYKRTMNALQSSPFAPLKPVTSQACRQIESMDNKPPVLPKQAPIVAKSPRVVNTQKNGQSIDLTAPNRAAYVNPQVTLINALKAVPQKLDILSAQFLPQTHTSNLLSCPRLTWSLVRDGICLQWDLQFVDPSVSPIRYEISSFQKSEIALNNFPWRKIGEVAALPLPMACTLKYVAKLHTYFFAIRAWVKEDSASGWSNVIVVETQ